MKQRTFKLWSWIHKWTSLVCTLFVFLLCFTGLPLIFHHEIEHNLGLSFNAPPMPENAPQTNLDNLTHSAIMHSPNEVIQYIIWEAGEENIAHVVMAKTPQTPPDDTHTLIMDTRTASVLGEPDFSNSFLFVLLKLHTDLFLGLQGKLFLGFMGLLFVLSITSGIVLYAPWMKKLDFAQIRRHKSKSTQWLDIHNFIGISTIAWVLVIGSTGVITSLADLAVQAWRNNQVAAMIAPYQGQSITTNLTSLEQSAKAAQKAAPYMEPSFIAFPGTNFSSPHHYAFFMRGKTKLTAYLWQPILIDATTAKYTDMRPLPWYMTIILLAKPLHFGDYGGLPLKILWAILSLFTITVTGSGLYLWLKKQRGKIL